MLSHIIKHPFNYTNRMHNIYPVRIITVLLLHVSVPHSTSAGRNLGPFLKPPAVIYLLTTISIVLYVVNYERYYIAYNGFTVFIQWLKLWEWHLLKTSIISGENLLYIKRICTFGCDWLLLFAGYALS